MTATAPATVQGEVSNTRGQVAIGTNINQNAIFLTVHLASNDPAQLDAVAQQIRLDPLGGRVTDWDRDFPGLIGRKGDVDVARDVLAGRGSIAVFGEEGIGKSVLLRHVARRTGDGFGGGVALIHGAGQRWQDIGQQVVRAFFRSSIPIYLGPAELRAVLKDLDALLLIDDADAADGIDELHAIALNSSFVVASTSRALAGESRGMMLGGLDDAAVHGLIVRTLQNLGQGSDLDAEVTTRIGRRLAGHPGRIIRVVEDAARRGVGLTALAQELEGQGDVAGDPVARLDGTAAAIVEAVAALDGAPVGPEHVASVLPGVSTGDVDELVDERILRVASPQVALDRDLWSVVRSSPEADVIRAHYLDHFVAWARTADPHAIAEESRAIVYLLNWAVEGQRHHQALALNAATEPAFAATGRWGAWTRATEVALEASTKLGDEAGAARALNQLAVQALGDDADDKARNLLVQARDRATRAGATFEAAVAERNLRVIDGLPVPPPIERGHGGNGLPWAKIAGIGVIALLLGAVLLLLLRPQPALGIEPAAHAFGSTAAVSTGERVAFVVSNTGGTMLERLEVRLSSDVDGFRAISEDCEGRTLGPGETCTVEVVFVPSGPGEGQATLTVTARDGTSISAAITGSIVEPTPPSPTPPPPTDSPPPSPTPTETGLPDLAIRSFTPTGRPFRSDSWVIPVVVEIVNVGPAVSDRFEIVVTADGEPVPFDVPGEDPERLVTDGPFGPDDPPLAYRGNLLLDPQTPLSEVRLVVEADSCAREPAPSPDCRIAEVERNQTNNSLELQAVDLQLSSLVVDEWRFQRVDPEATQSPYVDVNVAFDVVNAGTEDAGSFWIAASVGEILYPFMVVGDPGDDSDMLVQVPALASDDTLPITGVVAVPYELRDLRLDITAGCLAGSGECVLPEIAIENNTVSADIPQPPSVD